MSYCAALGSEIPGHFLQLLPAHIDYSAHCIHPKFRLGARKLFGMVECTDTPDVAEWFASSPEWVRHVDRGHSSSDGRFHTKHADFARAALVAAMALASEDIGDLDSRWLSQLPPADASTLHDVYVCAIAQCSPRNLVGQVRRSPLFGASKRLTSLFSGA